MASTNPASPTSAGGMRLLSADVRWLAAAAGMVIFVVATYFALVQAPRPDPMKPMARLSLEWWLFPYERNAFARLPVITGDLLDVYADPGGAKVWAVGDGGLIVHSGDGGRSWTRQRVAPAEPSESVQQTATPEKADAEVLEQARDLETRAAALGVEALDLLQQASRQEEDAATLAKDGKLTDKAAFLKDEVARLYGEATARRTEAENLRAQAQALRAGAGETAAAQTQAKAPPVDGSLEAAQDIRTDVLAVDFVDAKTGWAVRYDDIILHTGDGGATWTPQASGLIATLFDVHFVDAKSGWTVGNFGVTIHTSDGGATWTRQTSGTTAWLRAVHFVDARTGWAVGEIGTILHTGDGGTTWTTQASGTGDDLNAVHFVDAQIGWAVGRGGMILKAADGGTIWTQQAGGADANLIGVDFVDTTTGWAVGADGVILHTGDGGTTWVPQSRTGSGEAQILPDGQSGWLVTGDNTVEFTTDGGANWQTETAATYGRFPAPWYHLVWPLALGFIAPLTRDIARRRRREKEAKEQAGTRKEQSSPDDGAALTLTGRFASDRPLEAGDPDPLGFRKIARTISLFLRHEKTEPPLTFAITGEWGSGKSSLMNLLKADLADHGWRPVWFNAWHHQKEEHLLAALLDAIRRQAVAPWWQGSGLWARAKLMSVRLWRKRTLVFPAALLIAVMSVVYVLAPSVLARIDVAMGQIVENIGKLTPDALPDSVIKTLWKQIASIQELVANIFADVGLADASYAGVFAAALSVLILWWLARNRLTSVAFSPAKLLAALAGRPRAGTLSQKLAFRNKFAREFRDIALALSRPRLLLPSPLVVFIDDLDRCRPENVLDLLEAVNFLVSSGDCYVVIGMARDRVEGCIGLGFKEVAKELADEAGTAPESQAVPAAEAEAEKGNAADKAGEDETQKEKEERKQRREYARDYLEKLINIEVPVPMLDDDRARDLLQDGQAHVPVRARRLLRAAAAVERNPARALLLVVAIAAGLNLWMAPTPVISTPGESTAAGTAAIAEGAGEKVAETASDGEIPESSPQSETPPAQILGGQVYQPPVSAPEATGVLVFMFAGLLMWEMRRRMRADTAKDSDTFNQVLEIWRPVIVARRNTPRSVKRYLNRVRFLAMRLRPEIAGHDDTGVLAKLVKRVYSELKHAPQTPADEAHLREETLVALSAIEYCDREWLKKDAVFSKVKRNLAKNLKAARPEGVDDKVVDAIVAALGKHGKSYPGTWPPDRRQRDAFSEIAAGVRFAAEEPETAGAS